jgi:hypothetical protein
MPRYKYNETNEFETRCADSSIEVSQSELRSDAERSLDYEVAMSRAEEQASKGGILCNHKNNAIIIGRRTAVRYIITAFVLTTIFIRFA